MEVDVKTPCKATILVSFVIAEPLTNGQWRTINADNASFGVELNGYNHQQLSQQVMSSIEEFKKLWGNQILSLVNSQTDASKS